MSSTIRQIIATKNVDLAELTACANFMFIGFSLQSSFMIIKNTPRSKVSQSNAQLLKAEVQKFAQNKTKDFIRARIPGLLIGLIDFSCNLTENVSSATSLSQFKQFLNQLNSFQLDHTQTETLLTLCSSETGLGQSYYTSYLNRQLDNVASFFNGEVPNSFSNALREFSALLNNRKLELNAALPLPIPPSASSTTSDSPPSAPPTTSDSPTSATVLTPVSGQDAVGSSSESAPTLRVLTKTPTTTNSGTTQETTKPTSVEIEPKDNTRTALLESQIRDLEDKLEAQRLSNETQVFESKWKYGLVGLVLGGFVVYLFKRD